MRTYLIVAALAAVLALPVAASASAKTREQCRQDSFVAHPKGSLSKGSNARENWIDNCMSGNANAKPVQAKNTGGLAPKDEDAWMKRCLKSPTGGSEARCARALDMRKRGIDPTKM